MNIHRSKGNIKKLVGTIRSVILGFWDVHIYKKGVLCINVTDNSEY